MKNKDKENDILTRLQKETGCEMNVCKEAWVKASYNYYIALNLLIEDELFDDIKKPEDKKILKPKKEYKPGYQYKSVISRLKVSLKMLGDKK